MENLPAAQEAQSGELTSMERAKVEIQSQITVAKKYPRDEARARERLLEAMRNSYYMAQDAEYNLKKGSSSISGETVQLAKEIARIWGNLNYGFDVVSQSDKKIKLEGYCLDLESNVRMARHDEFEKLIERKVTRNGETKTEWIQPNERDLRELVNRRGSILVRNCIVDSLPSYLIAELRDVAAQTLEKGPPGTLAKKEKVEEMLRAFEKMGVNAAMVEDHLGMTLSQITEPVLLNMNKVWRSIKDKKFTIEEHFDMELATPAQPSQPTKPVADPEKKEETKQAAPQTQKPSEQQSAFGEDPEMKRIKERAEAEARKGAIG